MKNRLHRVSPKLTLAFSIVLLALSLIFLWMSTGFAMPTQGLAVRRAAAQQGLSPSEWELYFPSLDYKPGNAGGWYFSRQGDDFYVACPYRQNTILWSRTIGPYRITPLTPYAFAFNPIWDSSQENVGFSGSENLVLVTTPDPAVTRMELLLGDQRVECAESAPGSGFWVGTMRATDEDNLNTILAYAYAADGTLLHSTPPA